MTRLTTIFLACQTPKLYTLKIDLRGDPTSFGTLKYFKTYFLKKTCRNVFKFSRQKHTMVKVQFYSMIIILNQIFFDHPV